LSHRLRVPGQSRAIPLVESPRQAAVSGIAGCSIVWESGMLRWRVKSDVTQWNGKTEEHLKGLNRAIQVLVIDGVFIMPHSCVWSCHLVSNEEDTVIPRIWLNLGHSRASPGHNGRLLSHRVTHEIKRERLVDSNYVALAIGSVVKHVALVGMSLAPAPFVWYYVFRFGEVLRPLIERCV